MTSHPEFKRKLYSTLLTWKKERNGKTAALIEGARRVGKSTLVEQFARQEYRSYILIDFSKASVETFNLFRDISDLDYIFLRLQLIYNVQLYERESVIIFDEVQLQPLARQAIKHLVSDGRYDYIETGSLISIRKNVRGIVIPSEETRMLMHPMDYEEFRWALGDTVTIPLLRKAFESMTPLHEAHRKLMRDFRLYMLVGGMPQSISEYIGTNNLSKVDTVKREILELYSDDFHKIDPSGKISMLFEAIPSELNRNSSRYRVANAVDDARNDRMSEIIADLKSSMTVNISYNVNDPCTGLSQSKDLSRYKLFTADTGLFITLAFKDKAFTDNVIYQQLLSDKLSVNLGYVYENITAQMLRASGNELYYHTFPTESGKHNYEVDFLLARHNKICPIEIKSSGYKSHASLDAFGNKFSERIQKKYLIYAKDLAKEQNIVYLPFYMTPFI